jgi:hypothetical protein
MNWIVRFLITPSVSMDHTRSNFDIHLSEGQPRDTEMVEVQGDQIGRIFAFSGGCFLWEVFF